MDDLKKFGETTESIGSIDDLISDSYDSEHNDDELDYPQNIEPKMANLQDLEVRTRNENRNCADRASKSPCLSIDAGGAQGEMEGKMQVNKTWAQKAKTSHPFVTIDIHTEG